MGRTVPLARATTVVIFGADSIGYAMPSSEPLISRLFAVAFPLLTLAIAARLWIHRRRRTKDPTLAMMGSGLVLAMLGGVDRADVFTNSQIFAAGPDWFPRVAAASCIGIGAALIIRFLVFLVPIILRPPTPPTPSPTA